MATIFFISQCTQAHAQRLKEAYSHSRSIKIFYFLLQYKSKAVGEIKVEEAKQ